MKTIVIATPHGRNDALEFKIAETLINYRVIRLRAREQLQLEYLREINPEWIFFPHWPWIISAAIHRSYECVIFHMTDLPYGRGGSPLQNLIVRGHKSTMLSALKCVDELDGGPVYKKLPLALTGTAEEILQNANELIGNLIVEIVATRPKPVEQSGPIVKFKRRRPEDGNIADLNSIEQVYDFIRMLDGEGYPPAFIEIDNFRLEFTKARVNGKELEAKVHIRKKCNE